MALNTLKCNAMVLSTFVQNKFMPARGNLVEIFSILFHTLIAAHEYFPTCSMSLK